MQYQFLSDESLEFCKNKWSSRIVLKLLLRKKSCPWNADECQPIAGKQEPINVQMDVDFDDAKVDLFIDKDENAEGKTSCQTNNFNWLLQCTRPTTFVYYNDNPVHILN